jgi:polyhydroxybutyrate depolymerase
MPEKPNWSRIFFLILLAGIGGYWGKQLFTDLFADKIPAMANPSGLTHNPLNPGDQNRTYYLYKPKGLERSTKKHPLVIVIHGMAANGRTIMNYSRMNETADKYGFMVAYPEMHGWLDWDVSGGLNSKDIPFISTLIDTLVQNDGVDPKRVFATGYSSGGDLMHIFALTPDLAPKIAAYAPVCSNLLKSVAKSAHQSTKAVSMLMISGTGDWLNPWKGGINLLSVPKTFEFWKKHNDCNGADTTTDYPKNEPKDPTHAQLISGAGSQDQSAIQLLKINKGGHTWPGSRKLHWITSRFMGETNMDVSANEFMWHFFTQHAQP